ncbi:hypothetical protein ACIQ9P_00535 [Kitasatospora sp. NPDC094019]|uniref:hypothetical protein n=1 Tax=Kitasatospora sp. NPDC094019 TaxID=3364091 RepID=UPI003807C77C
MTKDAATEVAKDVAGETATRTAEDMTERNLRCLFLGDSFTQGVGDPEFRGWVGPPPVADAGAPHLKRLLSVAEGIAGVCAARGVPFVDVTAVLAADRTWVAEALAADGAHPGAGGYRRLADLVLRGGFREWATERGPGVA